MLKTDICFYLYCLSLGLVKSSFFWNPCVCTMFQPSKENYHCYGFSLLMFVVCGVQLHTAYSDFNSAPGNILTTIRCAYIPILTCPCLPGYLKNC